MKKWLLMFSVIALSNGLCAMGNAEPDDISDTWSQITDEEWNTINAGDAVRTTHDDTSITVEGDTINFNLSNDYPTIAPSSPIAVPGSHQTLHIITLAASPVPSSISYSSALSCSTNSQSSLPPSAACVVPKPTPVNVAAKSNTHTTFQQHSPIGLHHTIAASMLHMTSSIISTSSIETSADEDRGVDRCMVHDSDYDNSEDAAKKKPKKKGTGRINATRVLSGSL